MEPHELFPAYNQRDVEASCSVAADAFNAAKKHFEQSGFLSDQEKVLISSASRIEEVQKTVADSLVKYEAKRESSKTRKWLQKASETICHYGAILDVFVQHHPEYVALVWGTMKLLFIGVVNHGETLKLLAKSVSQVAARLPRFKLISKLYPTNQMRSAIESLYSCLLEFLVRAHGWCNESKFKHFCHSYTRPHELRYQDLLERITDCSNNIIELAAMGSQVELHLMHKTQTKKLDLIISLLESSGLTINDLVTKTVAFQSLQQSAQLDTNQRLSDLQLSQVLTSFSLPFEDANICYKHHLFFCNRRASGKGAIISTNQFWLSPKLIEWTSSHESALTIIKGSYASRLIMQDFCVNLIQYLTSLAVPTIWVLMNSVKTKSRSMSSTTDLMKYITFQVLRLGGLLKTEKQMSFRYSQLHTAKTYEEWLEIFKQVIEHLGGQIYIIVDLATVCVPLESIEAVNFFLGLRKMLENASQHGMAAKIKIMLVIYEVEWCVVLPAKISDCIIQVNSKRPKRRQGNIMRRGITTQMFAKSRGRLGRKSQS